MATSQEAAGTSQEAADESQDSAVISQEISDPSQHATEASQGTVGASQDSGLDSVPQMIRSQTEVCDDEDSNLPDLVICEEKAASSDSPANVLPSDQSTKSTDVSTSSSKSGQVEVNCTIIPSSDPGESQLSTVITSSDPTESKKTVLSNTLNISQTLESNSLSS